jgi:GH43 family beta-xylosidase
MFQFPLLPARYFRIAFLLVTVFASAHAQTEVVDIADLYVRDPYILPNPSSNEYYLYKAGKVKNTAGKEVTGVVAYKSKDLKSWAGPFTVYATPDENWAHGAIWAPEVHAYKGKYYLFATLNTDVEWRKREEGWPVYSFRGTQIFVSNEPLGPFLPFGGIPHTPMDEMALDGTLWEENGVPYMVYCHEWVQEVDGTMKLVRLKPDLSAPAEAPIRLFNASSAEWSTGSSHKNGKTSYVTDGCFLYKSKSGKLFMIWSSFKNSKYAIGVATSYTGLITGPWVQQKETLFDQHGGHGMLFKTFDGRLVLTFHSPNSPGGKERAQFYEIEDTGETLVLKGRL